jgi:hypothetical protein
MAGFSTLARLLTFGKAGGPKRPDGIVTPGPVNILGSRTRPPGTPSEGTAIPRADLAGKQVADTKPPDAAANESAAVAAARLAAQRTRRRMAVAGTGKAGTPLVAAQKLITGGGAPRSLIGYTR